MNRNQVAMVATLFTIFGALLALSIEFAINHAGRAASTHPAAVAAGKASAPTAESPKSVGSTRTEPIPLTSDSRMTHLDASLRALEKARTAIGKANPKGHGGLVEKVRTAVAGTRDQLAQARNDAMKDPERMNLPAPASTDWIDDGGMARKGQQNMFAALDDRKASFEELQLSPGGDLGGLRPAITQGIRDSAAQIVAAIKMSVAASGGAAPPDDTVLP